MEDSRDYQQQQRFVAEDISMVRTRGSAAGGTGDGGLGGGDGAAKGATANKNSLAGESGEERKNNKDSYFSATAMPGYREGTPPPEQQHWQQYISTSSSNINVPQANVEERQPPSPMVTPPTRMRSNAASHQAAKKSPPISAAGVPHVYHDYSRVPDEANFVRKKTGGVSKL